jgi:glucan-binding YG repeat protein
MKKQTKLGLVLAAAAVISVSVASLVSARGWVQNGADWYYVDNSGEYVTETIQSSGNAKFYLGEDGTMQRDYFLEDYNGNAYYFGQNGAMVTNTWVAVESSRVENQDEYVPDNYWYYFQASGKAMKGQTAGIKKTTIDGKKYAFNEYGQMCTGWIDAGGKTINPDDNENPFENATYYAGGDNDGVLRAGWVTYYDGYDGDGYAAEYTNLYFYFNTSNNTKYADQTKKINGRTYAFDDNGVMMSGWDVYDYNQALINGGTAYFSSDDDGHQVKKGWVYAVPAADIDPKAYADDEEKYMYFNASGEIVRDSFKKINGKYYVFNRGGIMKTGLVIWAPDSVQHFDSYTSQYNYSDYKFVETFDLDWATGEELSKRGRVRYGDEDNEYFYVYTSGEVRSNYRGGTYYARKSDTETRATKGDFWGNDKTGYVVMFPGDIEVGTQLKWHNFAADGSRKTGVNTVEFADDNFGVYTTSSGDKGSGTFAKKYYSLGVQLKANADIRYGIYNTATAAVVGETVTNGQPLAPQASKQTGSDYWYRWNTENGFYQVLNTGGSKQKGQSSARKDADGNYWLIDKGSDTLKGIWSVNVKTLASFGTNFKTRSIRLDAADMAELNRYGAFTQDGLTGGSIKFATISNLNAGKYYFIPEAQENGELNATNWYAHRASKNSNSVWFTLVESYQGHGFQSDINDQSNKWIPFGVLDNSNKTVTFKVESYPNGTAEEKRAHAYEVKPNNDYFLNCYWMTLD